MLISEFCTFLFIYRLQQTRGCWLINISSPMATLDELTISGIRNFSPDGEQIIKFTSPLTLILGQNGCGKTAIIEAIKYACIKKLPWGSSNKFFLFNSEFSGNVITNGQINLKLIHPREGEVVVNRTLGEASSSSITIGCSTEDKELKVSEKCCETLNVSAAILNNVIFCHQEDSFWPLDTPQTLKKKFDEIFEVVRYNKDIERLMDRKKSGKEELPSLRSECDKAEDKKICVERLVAEREENQKRIIAFDGSIDENSKYLEAVKREEEAIRKVQSALSQLVTKREEMERIRNDQSSLQDNISFPFMGSDEDLRIEIERTEDIIKEPKFSTLQQKEAQLEKLYEDNLKTLQDTRTNLALLSEQRVELQKKLSKQQNMIKEYLELAPTNSGEREERESAIKRIRQIFEKKQGELKKLTDDKESELAALQKEVDKRMRAKISVEQRIKFKQEHLDKQKSSAAAKDLDSLSTCDDDLKTCIAEIQNVDQAMKELRDIFKEDEERGKIALLDGEIETVENNLEICEKIENQELLIREKRSEIERIKEQHRENWKHLFQESLPKEYLKEGILYLQRAADSTVKSLMEKILKRKEEVTALEVQCETQKNEIESLENNLNQKRARISQVCNGNHFNETLERTVRQKESLQILKEQRSSVRTAYEQFIEEFEVDSPCCPVCKTDFSNKKNVVHNIITTLKQKIDEVPQELAKIEEELKKEEAYYDTLQSLKVIDEEIVEIEEKLPQLRENLKTNEEKLKDGKLELNKYEAELDIFQKKAAICSNTAPSAGVVDQNRSDIVKLQDAVEHLKKGLVQPAETKTDFLRLQKQELTKKVTDLNQNITDQKNKLQQLTYEKNLLTERQRRLEENVQKKRGLEKEISDSHTQISKLSHEISELENHMLHSQDSLVVIEEKRNNFVAQSKEELQAEQNKLRVFEKHLEEIENLRNDIGYYLDGNMDEAIALTEAELKKCEETERFLKESKIKVAGELATTKENFLKVQTLKNHVMLRDKKLSEAELECEIRSLKEQFGAYDDTTAANEKRELMKRNNYLKRRLGELAGRKEEVNQRIENLERELAKPENADAIKNYQEKLQEVETTVTMIDELSKKIKAEEKRVLDFHKQRLKQINKAVEEMWCRIYRGNDIDYIQIKAESVITKEKRREYNYKIMYVKNDIETDMRFCCSAGQKFLACLIIRMALAESLASDCRILALDAPTTNLDKENMKSLCDALCDIVRVKQEKENFQLVVISHDEEFLKALDDVHGTSGCYRVRRDENGFAVVEAACL